MKNKIILCLTAFILITALCACTEIPINSNSNTSLPDLTEGSKATDTSKPAESLAEESDQPQNVSKDESTDTSLPPVLDLPYSDPGSMVKADIKADSLDEYFKNAVFVGDSIMVHYKNFADSMKAKDSGYMGGAKILASSSFSAYHNYVSLSDKNATHPKYEGERRYVQDSIKQMGAEMAIISSMALNSLGLFNTDTCVDDVFSYNCRLIEDIKKSSPNIKIVVLSATYLIKIDSPYARLNNPHISQLNNKMLEYCTQNGYDFIDISSVLTQNGYLKNEYVLENDPQYCHLKQDCYAKWTAIFRNYSFAKQNGFYKNPESMPIFTNK
ncbi:hypothetical protein LJB90_02220 [Eubacteriales bacterium OttesenSCG-928-G02]|nr:hypothetical protein [Eubacteriales bacterium OttesenSCG-928-G02]